MVFRPEFPQSGVLSDYHNALFWQSNPHLSFNSVRTNTHEFHLGQAVKVRCDAHRRGYRVGVLRSIALSDDPNATEKQYAPFPLHPTSSLHVFRVEVEFTIFREDIQGSPDNHAERVPATEAELDYEVYLTDELQTVDLNALIEPAAIYRYEEFSNGPGKFWCQYW